MQKIDVDKIRKQNQSEDAAEALKCLDLLYDEHGGPALWHKCYCNYVSRSRNIPQHCGLTWQGKCLKNGG